jgi:hypothetical protein
VNRASLVLITLLAAGTVAHAQAPVPPNPADVALEEGRRLYDLREWDAAIAKFKEAYRLRPDAPSLFNIAQSNRLKGDCVEAASFYKTYKRNFPTEKNIDKVDKFITEMETCVKEGRSVKTTPTVTPDPKTTPVKIDTTTVDTAKADTAKVDTAKVETTTKTDTSAGGVTTTLPPPVDQDPGKTKRVAGLVIGGVGVAGLGASVFFGLRARSAANDAETAMMGDMWNPGIQTRGETAARNAKIAAGIGGALVITGGVLYMLGRKSSSESSSVSVVPAYDGASLVWAGGF